MTLARLAAVPSRLGMAAFVAVFFSYVDLHFYYAGVLRVPAAYIFLALLAALGFVPLVRATVSTRLRGELIALYAAHAWVLAALAAIMFCTFVFAFLPGAYWGDGPQYLLFPIYDTLVVLLAMLLPVLPERRRHLGSYVLCAFLVFLGSIFVDAAYPGTFSLIPDRAAGFADNPNTASFVLVLLCACLVDFRRLRAGSLIVMALTGLGVMATLSRGGGILLALVFLFYVYRTVRLNIHHPERLFRRAAALVALLGITFAAGAFLVGRADMFALSYQPRLGMLTGTEQLVSADDGRISVLATYIDVLIGSPIMGYGTGYTSSLEIGPHNIYLQQWINNGLPGLFAYLMLLVTCGAVFWRRRFSRGLLFIGLVAVYGFFNHNILEERAFLALLGVLLTVSFYGEDLTPVRGRYGAEEADVSRLRAPVRRHARPVGVSTTMMKGATQCAG